MKEMNLRQVTITMIDNSVFRGCLNISSCRRLSDFFRKPESLFIVLFDARKGEDSEKKVYFINSNHILWVEPSETGGREGFETILP